MKTAHQVRDEQRAREGVATHQGDTDTPPALPPEETGSEPVDPSASSGKGRCQGRNKDGNPCGKDAVANGYCRHHPRTATDRGPSQATVLADIAEARAELWHDPDGEAWATIEVDGHREHHRVRTRPFRTWLRRRYFDLNGKAPGSQGVQDAVENLCGAALFAGDERTVHVRVAEHDGAVYLDLADPGWRAVEVTADGWRVVDEPPVIFRRRAGMQALPEPEPGGRLDELRRFVNVADSDWPLVVAWLVAAVRPRGPYPVLNVYGEQGVGKSSTCRALRRLFDPNEAALRRLTRDERDLVLAASNGACVAFENVSGLQPWQSDALAALSTGTGFATRTLYENDEETIFSACRPIILNGISDLASRPDLLDRSILLELAAIDETERLPEDAFWPAYYQAQPRMLGALLDAVAAGLARIDAVHLDRLPRMADFAKWIVACEPALGIDDGAFLAAYARNRQSAHETALDESPVAPVVRELVVERGEWTGTSGELHVELTTEDRKRSKTWPQSGQAMASALKSAAPSLRASGMDVIYDPSHRDANGRRLWTFRLGTGAGAGSAGVPKSPSDLHKRPGTPPGTPRQSGSPPGSPGTPPGTPHEESAGPQPGPHKASGTPALPAVLPLPNLVTPAGGAGDPNLNATCPRCGAAFFTVGPAGTWCASCSAGAEAGGGA
jgi:hypothetical protein